MFEITQLGSIFALSRFGLNLITIIIKANDKGWGFPLEIPHNK